MNYKKIHDKIILNAKLDNKRFDRKEYYEEHHIKPKSLYPEIANLKKYPENGVLLTAKEHFIIHRLLTKIYPNSKEMHYAIWLMACVNKEKISSRTYEYLRKHHAINIKNDIEANKKKGLAHKGKKQSKQHTHLRVKSKEGYKHSKETKEKISKANKGRKYKPGSRSFGTKDGYEQMVKVRKKNGSFKWTEEQKMKASNSKRGISIGPFTEEHKKNMRKPKSKMKCPHCGYEGRGGIMKRWHFDNCKILRSLVE